MALGLLMLSACTTMKAYPGPRLPKQNVATACSNTKFWGFWAKSIDIVTVDGGKVGEFDQCVEMLPGLHVLTVHFFEDVVGFVSLSRSDCRLILSAEANGRYRLQGSVENFYWHAWMVDEATGATVAKCFFDRGSSPSLPEYDENRYRGTMPAPKTPQPTP